MKDEIKIKKGFKQTEVGIIPNDWILKSIEDLSIPNGLVRGPFGGALKKEIFFSQGYKVYEQRNAIYGCTSIGNYFISSKKYEELKRFEIKEGDFIVSCSGTIGKIYQIPKKYEKGIINQALLKISFNKSSYSNKYFKQYFAWDKFQKRIIENTQGGAMKNLVGMSEFKKTLIPLPPTKDEQIAIAEALNDADELISQLEKLITKKRAIKQGALQELLIPQKGWEIKSFKEILKKNDGIKIGPFGSQLKKELLTKSGFKVYGQENVFENNMGIGDRFINKEHFQNLKSCELRSGDFIISMMGTIGKCMIVAEKFLPGIMDSHLIRLRLDDKIVSIHYLHHFFSSEIIKHQVSKLSVGGIMEGLSSKIVKDLTITLPPTTDEQVCIARILSDMDAEIEALEEKLEKYEMTKQGMMQNLLTGKIRLV
jgi:type I restriction enzyme, S subunit